LHCLSLSGFAPFYPRLRERQVRSGRTVERRPGLFIGYAFIQIVQQQFYAARWCPGTLGLLMNGMSPAKVSDEIIGEIRQRAGPDGLIDLVKPPRLRPGDRVRILRGPFRAHLAIYSNMKPRQRVEVLLELLGAAQKVVLAEGDIDRVD
jgi:transcriptional antiterminator RfaH